MDDEELIAALMSADLDELERIVATLPAESVQPLLGMIGAGDTASAPDSPAAQAVELDAGYLVRPHLQLLSDRLSAAVAAVEAGVDQKLLVAMPPRHGKTELTSVYLPLWLLRQNHRLKIGIISHSPNLAAVWGRRIRRIVERHGAQLGLSIAPDAGAVSEWETPEGGGVMSRSIGQALAGVGFNVLIIDDPTRDFAAAHSPAARQAVWEWFTVNALTRLEPPSLVIVIQTRWHEDDLTGRILSPDHEGDPAEWEQIILPALAGDDDPLGRAPGEPLLSPLIPNETPAEALVRFDGLRRSVGSYAWSALFQQSPTPASGAIFDTGWWRYWTSDPAQATEDGRVRYLSPADVAAGRVIDSWDATFKDTASSDFVVGQRWARVGANRFLLAQRRGRMSFTATLAAMREWLPGGLPDGGSSPHAAQVHERLIEDKANGPAIIDALRDEISGLKPVNPRGSKEARARAVTPEIESGNVYLPLPSEAPWVTDLISELRSFPAGEHDDQVDALSQALDALRTPGGAHISAPGGAAPGGGSGRPSAGALLASRRVARNVAAVAATSRRMT